MLAYICVGHGMWKFIISDHPRMNGLCVRHVVDRDVDVRLYTNGPGREHSHGSDHLQQ